MRLCNVGRGWPLCVAILAIVETILGAYGNTVHRAKAIARDIGAATKWARIWFHVRHIPASKVLCGLLLSCFPALKQGLNPAQRCHVSEAETFSKDIRQRVDSDVHGHRFRVREFGAVNRNIGFLRLQQQPLGEVPSIRRELLLDSAHRNRRA